MEKRYTDVGVQRVKGYSFIYLNTNSQIENNEKGTVDEPDNLILGVKGFSCLIKSEGIICWKRHQFQ